MPHGAWCMGTGKESWDMVLVPPMLHHTCCCDVADNKRSMRSSRAAVSIRALAAWSGSELRARTGRRGANWAATPLNVACWVLIERSARRWLLRVWLTAVSGKAHRRIATLENADIETAIVSVVSANSVLDRSMVSVPKKPDPGLVGIIHHVRRSQARPWS